MLVVNLLLVAEPGRGIPKGDGAVDAESMKRLNLLVGPGAGGRVVVVNSGSGPGVMMDVPVPPGRAIDPIQGHSHGYQG